MPETPALDAANGTLAEQLAAGDPHSTVVEPSTIVIFGGAGDLAHRKLLPALYNLHVDGFLPPRVAVVGTGRTQMSDDAFREFAKDGVTQFSRRPIDERVWETFAPSLFFVTASIDDGLAALGARLDVVEHERGLTGNRIYYLAVPPSLFVPTVQQLKRARFVATPAAGRERPEPQEPARKSGRPARAAEPSYARLVIEKPIGSDIQSACAINDAISEVFDERQIYRIDHYLGKETVQNILVLRFANSIFEPLFNQKYVDHVQITVAESEGVGTRAGYYDQAGALRDMVQNHLLQLMTLVATEPPYSLDAEVVRDEKLELLRSLRPLAGRIEENVVRGQYAAGFEFGKPAPGYKDEPGVDPHSRTETFVALRLWIDNWRWAGVPFLLRTGKRLPKRASEISVHLKEVPPILFNASPAGALAPNVLSIRIQPDEGFALGISSKIPGPRVRIYPVQMDFRYNSTFGGSSPEAYERLLLDVMAGDQTLFMRRDAVETAWRLVMPILEHWANDPGEPIPTYEAGSWGPREADRLMEPLGRKWRAL
jgi:glucose-6-phosphate 1-dehydrogenase